MDAIFKVLIEFKNRLHIKYYSWNISKGYGLGKQKQKAQNKIKKAMITLTSSTCMNRDGNI